MNNIKLNYALIFAMVLQAIGLIWYVSKLDSKVETVYKFYEQESQKSVVVTQAKMQFDLERVIKDIEDDMINEAEDTLSILSKYVNSLNIDNKKELDNLLISLYNESLTLETI